MKGAIPLEPKASTLSDALAELDALVKPEGVDAKLWDELKGALREALLVEGRGFIPRRNSPESGRRGVKRPPFSPDSGNQNPEPGWPARRTLKLVSSPPTGAANRVQDLTATRETNGVFTLSWHYRNIGDYDQNGVVGVSDLSPLAMRYNETYDKEAESNSIQAVIDGSGSGKVDVADVTQIAQYFGCEFAQYAIQGGDQQQGPFTQAFTMELPAEGRSDARLAFAFSLGAQPPYTYWRVAPLDGANNPGEASNVATLNVEAAVRILGVTPLQGLAGADVTFTAFVAGTGPFAYEWDFGGGATPNVSTAAQPTVTLNSDTADTQYAAQVKVTGANGSATRNFTLTVTTSPGNPPVINSVGPLSGLSGEQLNFSADVTGDGPLAYSWEFDGGASPPVSADANPTAILSRGGTLPSPNKDYPCRLTVTNDSGAASADFTLTISAQWHFLDMPFENLHLSSLTPNGEPIILRGTSTDVRCDIWNGGTWDEEIIPSAGYGAIAFDPVTGEPGAAAIEGNGLTGHVMYIHRNQGQWIKEDIAINEGWVGRTALSLAYRDNGSPIAAWAVVGTPFKVRVAQRSGAEWTIDTLPAPEGGAASPIVFIDGGGSASIMYSSQTVPPSIWIAKEEAVGWQIREALSAGLTFKLAQTPERKLGVVAVDYSSTFFYAEEQGNSWITSDIYAKTGSKSIWADGLAYYPSEIPLAAFGLSQYVGETEQLNELFFAWPDGPSWTILPLNDAWTGDYDNFRFIGLTPAGELAISGTYSKGSSVGSLIFFW